MIFFMFVLFFINSIVAKAADNPDFSVQKVLLIKLFEACFKYLSFPRTQVIGYPFLNAFPKVNRDKFHILNVYHPKVSLKPEVHSSKLK